MVFYRVVALVVTLFTEALAGMLPSSRSFHDVRAHLEMHSVIPDVINVAPKGVIEVLISFHLFTFRVLAMLPTFNHNQLISFKMNFFYLTTPQWQQFHSYTLAASERHLLLEN